MEKSIYIYIFIAILLIYYCIFIFSQNYSDNLETSISNSTVVFYYSSDDFVWPTPGYYTISSGFGKRVSPTTGASTYHSGIDISAPTGTSIYSVTSGKVIFTGFYGADGYTLIIQNNNLKILYGHLSPNYIVSVGDTIQKRSINFLGRSKICI